MRIAIAAVLGLLAVGNTQRLQHEARDHVSIRGLKPEGLWFAERSKRDVPVTPTTESPSRLQARQTQPQTRGEVGDSSGKGHSESSNIEGKTEQVPTQASGGKRPMLDETSAGLNPTTSTPNVPVLSPGRQEDSSRGKRPRLDVDIMTQDPIRSPSSSPRPSHTDMDIDGRPDSPASYSSGHSSDSGGRPRPNRGRSRSTSPERSTSSDSSSSSSSSMSSSSRSDGSSGSTDRDGSRSPSPVPDSPSASSSSSSGRLHDWPLSPISEGSEHSTGSSSSSGRSHDWNRRPGPELARNYYRVPPSAPPLPAGLSGSGLGGGPRAWYSPAGLAAKAYSAAGTAANLGRAAAASTAGQLGTVCCVVAGGIAKYGQLEGQRMRGQVPWRYNQRRPTHHALSQVLRLPAPASPVSAGDMAVTVAGVGLCLMATNVALNRSGRPPPTSRLMVRAAAATPNGNLQRCPGEKSGRKGIPKSPAKSVVHPLVKG